MLSLSLFAKRNGRCREGTGTTGSPCGEANRALVTVFFAVYAFSIRSLIFLSHTCFGELSFI
jgi:hypothetical protein